jgi:hypothetical protein
VDWTIRGLNPGRGERFFSSSERPDRFYGTVDTGVLYRRYSGRSVKFITHVHVVPRLRMSGVIPLLLFHGVTGAILPFIMAYLEYLLVI